jgi:RNA polymerase sigma-70 factor (ECF subfamily)
MSHTPDGPAASPLLSLLATAAAGDLRGQEALLAVLHIPIRRYLAARLARTRDPGDLADDLAQDTLIHLLGRLPQCAARSDAQVVAWALTVARTRLIDHIRRSRARPSPPAPDASLVRAPGAGVQTDRLLARIVRRAFTGIPCGTARLIRMRVLEGRTWPQVATEMRTTTAAAKRRFQRAQSRLRRALEEAIAALPDRDRAAIRLRLRMPPAD